jgi:hypothetical protein
MRHPIQLLNYMRCLMESLTLFYTKMSFKILKFSNRPSVFFPSNLLKIAIWQSRQVSCQLDNIEGATCPRTWYIYHNEEYFRTKH